MKKMETVNNHADERILYLECQSGISGDMTVGALLDLGASRERLEQALASLGVDGYYLHFGRTKKCGIDAFDFEVHLEGEHGGHSHGDHVHGNHVHEEAGHVHGEHIHGEAGHVHRNIRDVFAVIDRLEAEEEVKVLARRMFELVAEAEAKAHGLPLEEVHFHEVGAIDSIVDIISVAFCIHDLGIQRVAVSPLSEGRGYVRCQHGVIPVPVPATVNIAAACGLTLAMTDNEGEMVTPTGAAIAAALRTEEELPGNCRIERIGIGAGKKDFKNANILRAMLLVPAEKKEEEKLWVLETNLDDCTGEALGLAMELLLEEGAADVWYTPAYMKKNRPAYVLHVLCAEERIAAMEQRIFSCTTTIGVRRYPVERTALPRREEQIMTRYGEARVKVCRQGEEIRVYPEYESIRAFLQSGQKGFSQVYHDVLEDACRVLEKREKENE